MRKFTLICGRKESERNLIVFVVLQTVRPSRNLVAEVFIDLNNAATDLNEAAGDVVTSTYASTEQLGSSAEHYSSTYKQFVDGSMQIVTSETVSFE